MLDVVPPTSPVGRYGKKRAAPRASRRARPMVSSTSPSVGAVRKDPVVKVAWQLPARLRRPVREEMKRQRQKLKRQRAIINFERRPIYSELPSSYPKYRATGVPPVNTGVEHHTGDVYMHSRPEVRLGAPPYQGRFVGNVGAPRPVGLPASRPASVAPQNKARSATPAPRPARPVPAKQPKATKATLPWYANDVRDVPYKWPEGASVSLAEAERVLAPVQKPARRFALPLHFSIFPWRSRTQAPDSAGSKKKIGSNTTASAHRIVGPKVVNLFLLGLGCLAVVGLLSHLQGAGRGLAALGSISQRAEGAYEHLLAAQSALAETDFSKSEAEFTEAQELLQAARGELTTALASSRVVLRYADVTGRVRSGEELLRAGEAVTNAGKHASRGIEPLLQTKVVAEEGSTGEPSMVDALAKTFEEFTVVHQSLGEAEAALDKVNEDVLPPDIASAVTQLREVVPKARGAVGAFLDQSQVMLSVLGAEHSRQYLVVFENNHELRATGGFIGSIALLNVDRGVVEDINVQSVYDPDGQLKEYIAPPDPLLAITNRWYLRDANWFVDFSVSAQKIAEFFEKEGGSTVDGVIAMTPEVIKGLLRVTGPITVPGYDVTVTADNFVVLTQDQVTYDYDREANRPKQFLADLTPLLLQRVFAAPAPDSMRVLGVMGQMIKEKQLLIYFRDPQVQERVAKAGWDGALPKDAQGFLNVVNTNIGGHKSDQFIEQELDYRTTLAANGDAEVVLTIRRTHHGPVEALEYDYPEGENPAYKDNIVYQRVLVPQGAQLLEAEGYTVAAEIPRSISPEPDLPLQPDGDVAEWQRNQVGGVNGTMVGQEAGYTTFANWMITKPGATTVGLYRYRLPGHAQMPGVFSPATTYRMYIAKQPGDTRTMVRAEVRLPAATVVKYTEPADGITQADAHTVVYRGALKRDTVVGMVYSAP